MDRIEFHCAGSYSELSPWQREEICLRMEDDRRDFQELYREMVLILLMGDPSRKNKKRVQRLLSEISIEQLLPLGKFLLTDRDLFSFPEIWDGLTTPLPRLSNCTIRQFSVADMLFYQYSKKREELYARQLVASLYCWGASEFDPLLLPKIAEVTDSISPGTRAVIVFAYRCTREYIIERYPAVFPKSSYREDTPIFRRQGDYTPFSKVIAAMAMDSTQPLGNWHECSATRLYDFLEILNESILRSKHT